MAVLNSIVTRNVNGTYYTSLQVYESAQYVVTTPTNSVYIFLIPNGTSDPSYIKSTDLGKTWAAPVSLKACTCTGISVWADWWSGITATAYIHVVYTDSVSDDTFYRYIDTANSDTLGTERTVFAGSSTATGGTLAITRARGGNLICATCIDAGAEYDTVKSTDLFVNKTSISEVFEGASSDIVKLFPNPDSADNQDVCAIFYDSSASELSLKKYDDSGDSWAETSIVASLTGTTSAQFAVAMDGTTQAVLVAWNAVDAANADLLCWTITDSAITAKTDVITNSVDDQGTCMISIDATTGVWKCFYKGESDGSESYASETSICYKLSSNDGTSWGTEVVYSNGPIPLNAYLANSPVTYAGFNIIYQYDTTGAFTVNITIPNITARATYVLGM